MPDYNDALIQEILKNMSPEDTAQMGQAYQQQVAQNDSVGHPPTPEQAHASMLEQLAKGNIPTEGSLGGMTLQQQPQGQQGPPAPVNLNERRAESIPITQTISTSTPIDMGRFNPLGVVPKGNDSGSIDDLLNKLRGQTDPSLLAAQSARNQMQLFSLLGKSANQILGGQTHTKPSNEVWDALAKQGEQGVADIGTRNELVNQNLKQQQLAGQVADQAAKDDPKSSISTLYRAAAEKMLHGKLPDNISAAQLEKVSPVFEKLYSAEQAALDRQARMAEMNEWRKTSVNSRIENQANSRFDKNLGPFATRIEGANRALDVLDQVKSGKIIDTNQLYNALNSEITQLFMNVQSGGSLTDREEGRIHSLQALKAKAGAWVGKPMSAIPPNFLPQIEQEINLLKNDYVNAYQRKAKELGEGTSFDTGKNVIANRSKSFLGQQNLGTNPESTSSKTPAKYDQDVLDYAKEHGITPDQANQIKIQRTQGQ